MVSLRSSAPENLNIPEQMQQGAAKKDDARSGEISDYELCREERIRENRERMQKLGIFDLTQKLNALKPSPAGASRRKAPRLHSPLPPPSSGPIRRSSRLQTSTPISYCEILPRTKDKVLKEENIMREVGSKPEVYTEEHDKMLGSTEMSWTLFVDGYGKDGKRIYDPVKGKTCHQCRQKTLGHRTRCSKCNMVQGQFCGDCLYMRYGENVLEAKANPNWLCPVCRGICNCSLCRQAKGWPPTGMLYKKISSLGYKSVAHYLIQTRRANTDTENNAGSKVPVSAKRSLPFTGIEVTGEDDDPVPISDKESGDAVTKKDQIECPLMPEPEIDTAGWPGCDDDKETILLADSELDKSSTACVTVIEQKTTEPLNDEEIIPEALERGGDAYEIEKEKSSALDYKDVVASETNPKSTKKRVCCEPAPESIGARLRMRCNKGNTSEELQLVNANHARGITEDAYEIEKGKSSALDNKDVVASKSSPKSTKKRACCEPTPDSIGARLRTRRNKGNMSDELQLVNASHTKGITEDASTTAAVEGIATRLRKRCRV